MKKILFAGAIALGLLNFSACDAKKTENKESDETVVDRDSVPSEYKVTEKVVETDTTVETKTVDVDEDKKDKK
jgi:hypothetical protein